MMAEKIFYACFEKTFNKSNLYSKMGIKGKFNTNEKISETVKNFSGDLSKEIELHQDLYDAFDTCLDMYDKGRIISQGSFIEFVKSGNS